MEREWKVVDTGIYRYCNVRKGHLSWGYIGCIHDYVKLCLQGLCTVQFKV